jgi:hypothetical protein
MTARRLGTVAAGAATMGIRLADGAFMSWRFAHVECELSLRAWEAAGPEGRRDAHVVYRAALDREEAAARDFEEVCRVTGQLATERAT